jgi:formylglycine-generating enzyme required for sulfatase activity
MVASIRILFFFLIIIASAKGSILYPFNCNRIEYPGDSSLKIKQARDAVMKEIVASLILIPSGTFEMGCTPDQGSTCSLDELPVHEVSISTFYLSSNEVKQGWYKAFMLVNPSTYRRSDDFPVERVSYQDVVNFIDSLNAFSHLSFRLPTEAEWEYSARGADKFCKYRYSGGSDANEVAWNGNNSAGKTHVVRLKAPNHLGLYDLSGNVWEWVADWYGEYTSVAQNDPRGPSSGVTKVIRGGSYAGSPDFCRNSIRHQYPTDFKAPYIGFRLALNLCDLE